MLRWWVEANRQSKQKQEAEIESREESREAESEWEKEGREIERDLRKEGVSNKGIDRSEIHIVPLVSLARSITPAVQQTGV
jgi:hypothetical protein